MKIKYKVNIGEKYNHLTVLELDRRVIRYNTHNYPYSNRLVKCQCDCENKNILEVEIGRLINGRIKSCGCINANKKIKLNIGERYGYLTIIEQAKSILNAKTNRYINLIKCVCDCGKEMQIKPFDIKNGIIKSCGCNGCLIKVGDKFGKLTVVESRKFIRSKDKYVIKCQCECGKKFYAQSYNLSHGLATSCGCGQIKIKHGLSKDRLYRIWNSMHRRCYDKKQRSYQWYGLRGINVCNDWKDFNNFRLWAISNGYNNSLTIDRLHPYKDYCPENCVWVTKEENSRRRNLFYTRNYIEQQKIIDEQRLEIEKLKVEIASNKCN